MPTCSICNEYASVLGHQCPPAWHVWPDGNEEGFDPDEASIVYADSAENAALKFADEHTDCDAWSDDLFVRTVGEETEPVRFEVSHYIQPVYEVSIVKPKKPAALTIEKKPTL
jgi:hypothetical protein